MCRLSLPARQSGAVSGMPCPAGGPATAGGGLPQMQQHQQIDARVPFCISWCLSYDDVCCVNSQPPPHVREVNAACGERAGLGVGMSRSAIAGGRSYTRAAGSLRVRAASVWMNRYLTVAAMVDVACALLAGVAAYDIRYHSPDQSAGRVRGADAHPAAAVVGRGRAVRRVRQPDRRRRSRGIPPHPACGREPDRRRRRLLLRHEAGPGARLCGPRPALAHRPGHARPVRAPQAAAPPAAPGDLHPPDGGGGTGAHGDRADHGAEPGHLPWPVHRGGVRAGRPGGTGARSRASRCPAGWTA